MRSAIVAAVLCFAQVAAAQLPSIPGFARSRRERQSDAAEKLRPAELRLQPPSVAIPVEGGEPRAFKVRVYAARDYRNQTFNWASKLRRLIDRINKTTQRWPAVRFELVEVKNWERDSATQPMAALLDELERLDPGRDVELVIGLIAAVPILPTQIHNLGMARSPGRHFVLRSLHDLAELEALRRNYDELPDDARDRLLAERKAQKEQVVFLHEWAHTLGAIHAIHSDLIMNPEADAQQSRFCAPNARLIEIALRHRLGDGDEQAMRKEMADYIQSARFEDWDVKDRDQKLAFYLGRAPAAAAAPPTAAAAAGGEGAKLAEPDRALLGKAVEYYKVKDYDNAWKTLELLVGKYPRNADVQNVACVCAAARPAGKERARAVEWTCRAAAALSPDDPQPPLILAGVYLDAHLDDKAATAIAQAHQRLDYKSGATPGEWRLLAEAYVRAVSPADAVEAASHGDPETRRVVEEWALGLRRRDGLPAGALPADRERVFVRAFELAGAAIEGGQLDAAAMLVENVERDFAAVPGAQVLRCQLELARKHAHAMEAACTRALAAQEDAVAAHYYLAQLPARVPSKAAVAHLRRVIALAPDVEPAWRLLAQAYRLQHERAALDALRADYQKQFHAPLEESAHH
ncbi:MAG TPA: hypothetical protein VFF06_22920 [Polyangia bacterium]|nr:hypothetical protein [Polyangia bacterium]